MIIVSPLIEIEFTANESNTMINSKYLSIGDILEYLKGLKARKIPNIPKFHKPPLLHGINQRPFLPSPQQNNLSLMSLKPSFQRQITMLTKLIHIKMNFIS